MKKQFFWRISLIATATVLSLIFFIPSTQLHSSLPEWLQKYGMVLGLDLQGGVHLVYEVDGEKAVDVTKERIVSSLINIFKEKKIEGVSAEIQNGNIIISPDSDDVISTVTSEFPNIIEHSRAD